MPSVHARRNASGSKRWMKCTASIMASAGRPNNSSPAARLGTAAHALGETCLLTETSPSDWLGGVIRLDQREEATVFPPAGSFTDGDQPMVVPVHASADGLPPEGHEDFPIDANMVDAVTVYTSFVRDEQERLGLDAELGVETQFNLNQLIGFDFDEEAYQKDPKNYISPSGYFVDDNGILRRPDGLESLGPMFGTNDASVYLWMDHLTVIDYKHGQGVAVEVYDVDDDGVVTGNPQEMYYALGMAYKVDWAFETLDLVIVQPRKPHEDGPVRRYSTTKAELKAFEAKLREKALETEDPSQVVFIAGDHCQFCPYAGAPCEALTERAFTEAAIEFDDITGEPSMQPVTHLSSDEQLARAAAALPLLNAFCKAVSAEQLRRLMETEDGIAPFGKLVRKKSNRTWVEKDKDKLVADLTALGFPKDDLFEEPKLRGPAKIEKLRPAELIAQLKADGERAPAKRIEAIIAGLCHKPEGGITVAPLNDPRDPVAPTTAAESDFDSIEGEE